MQKFHFRVSNNVINHLGLNLYNSLSAVLYELIANSYDAEASEVKVEIQKEEKNSKNKVYIYDNGIGMSNKDFEDRYLEVAKDSRLHTLDSKRAKIGRKGLGKISVYALSNTVCVFSKTKNTDIIGMEINYKEAAETRSPNFYTPKIFANNEIPKLVSEWFNKYNNGTVTVINSCRRNFNKITLEKIPSEIEKNFYLTINNSFDPFNIVTIINNSKYIIKRIEPNFNCDFIFNFNTEKEGSIETLTFNEKFENKLSKDWLEKNRTNGELFISNVYNQEEQKEIPLNIEIKGWIGTLNSLKDIDKNRTAIPLIVRNRIVKDNIIDEYNIQRFWTKYFVGELILDYMDVTNIQDIISPNRQGFDSNVDDRYEKTKYIIEKIVKLLISKKDNRKKKEDNKKKQLIEDYKFDFSNKIQELKIEDTLKKDIIDNYSSTVGLKVINKDYIIFISHCSKKRCNKSYQIGNYLFNIISKLIKDNKNIKVERVIFTSNKKHDGRVKAGEDIYGWMKAHALNEKFPNSIFISCISEDFLINWNTIIEFGSAWVADKKNYSFVWDRKKICTFSSLSGIDEPLDLTSQNFDFNDKTDYLPGFLSDIFTNLISEKEISEVIKNLNFNTVNFNCSKCLELYNSTLTSLSIQNVSESNTQNKTKQ